MATGTFFVLLLLTSAARVIPDIFYLHDTDTLGDAIGLCLLDTPPPPAEKDLGNTTDVTAADEDDGPVMDTSLTTAWVRTKSTRNIFSASEKQSEKEVTETKKSPEAVPAEVDAKSEPDKHDEYTEEQKGAASKIQLAFRVCLLPIVKLKKQLQDIRADTKKKVEKSQKDCSKKITKIQKQFEKDCKKVDQLAKDIRRHQKKEKQLKKDIKGATKTRDNLRKKNEKERDKAKKCDKYLRRLDQDRKHLATWDRDIADVQAENEQLLGLIAKISEEISMRGVNWIELTKEVEVSPEKSNGDKPWWERAAEKKAPVKPTASATKISSAPLRVPHRRKLKGVLEKQESRQNMLSMVRQGSQRILQQKDPKDIEVAPIYFARVNSRARLFG